MFIRAGRVEGFHLVFSATPRRDCGQSSGKLISARWEGSAKTHLWEGIIQDVFCFILRQNCPGHWQWGRKAALVVFDLITISLSYFLRRCLALRNVLHLLKISAALVFISFTCHPKLLGYNAGSMPEVAVPHVPTCTRRYYRCCKSRVKHKYALK